VSVTDLPGWYFITVAAVFGALVGSFLNVVIARVPLGLSVVRPGSRCPGCERPIAWYENIPILSWIALRGRCRGCRMAISIRYPLVELATSLLAVACVRQFGPSPWAVAAFAFLAALVALTYIDLDYWLLPHGITIPFIALGMGAAFIPGRPDGVGIASSALGAGAGFASFWLIGFLAERLLKKEALGGGDLWLFAMIGAWLGAKALLPVALLASSQGAVIGVVLLWIARRRSGRPGEGAEFSEAGHRGSAGAGGVSTEAGGVSAEAGGVSAEAGGVSAGAGGVSAGAGGVSTEAGDVSAEADGVSAEARDASTGAGHPGPDARSPISAIAPPKPTGDEELDDWVPPEGAIPFGPFLALGAAEYLFFGERLVEWYLSLIRFQG